MTLQFYRNYNSIISPLFSQHVSWNVSITWIIIFPLIISFMYVLFEIISYTENNTLLESVFFALSSICIKFTYPVNSIKNITLEVQYTCITS